MKINHDPSKMARLWNMNLFMLTLVFSAGSYFEKFLVMEFGNTDFVLFPLSTAGIYMLLIVATDARIKEYVNKLLG